MWSNCMTRKSAKSLSRTASAAALVFLSFVGCREHGPQVEDVAGGLDSAGEAVSESESGGLNIGRNLPVKPPMPAPCDVAIDPAQELMITDLSVVEDVERTKWTGDPEDMVSGAWNFGRLLTAMAGEQDPAEFATRWLQTWAHTTVVSGVEVPARVEMNTFLSQWPRLEDGTLDMARAPARLLAIVNRTDLADTTRAGEGRFIFGFTRDDAPLEFAVNLEYSLSLDVMSTEEWAAAWHALGDLELGTPAYNEALQEVTDAFTQVDTDGVPDTVPRRTDLAQLRTNENEYGHGVWEMREFAAGADGFLAMQMLALTPAQALNGTVELRDFINENEAALLDGTYTIPLVYDDLAFQAAATRYSGVAWTTPPTVNNDARRALSLNTCDACHGAETTTDFLHVQTREAGAESVLSGFLTGIDVVDPGDGVTIRHYADLQRRSDALAAVVCP